MPLLILHVRSFPIGPSDFPSLLTVSRISDQACRGKAATVLNRGGAPWQKQGCPGSRTLRRTKDYAAKWFLNSTDI